MSTEEAVDAIVIGMGPGGEDVAGRLAEAGLSVVGIDSALVGGECPYWGCVPSKMMIRAAHLLAEARRVQGMAGDTVVRPDWTPVAARIRSEATDDWDDTVAVERFENKGGLFVRGRARLTGRDAVAVGDRRFRATRAVVIATGSSPAIPPIPGLADTPFWTNHDAIEAKELPASIIVLGGGPIGAELAQVYARFAVDTTIVEAATTLLPLEDPDAGTILADVLANEGVTVISGAGATNVSHADGRFSVRLADGRHLEAERLLVATGRRVDLASIGADALGVDPTLRAMPVDDHLRVVDGVWAVGDVTGRGAFTHVAMYQAGIAVADILGLPHTPADYRALPRVTFTDPEVASVGCSVQAAADSGTEVAIGRAHMPATARGWLHKAGNEGFITLVADRARDVLVGATVMGPNAGEVISMLTLAIHAEIPLAQLRTMMYAYPTFHRGVEDALRQLT